MEHMIVNSPPDVAGAYSMTEGRLTKQVSFYCPIYRSDEVNPQLKDTGPVVGTLVPVSPWADRACTVPANAAVRLLRRLHV